MEFEISLSQDRARPEGFAPLVAELRRSLVRCSFGNSHELKLFLLAHALYTSGYASTFGSSQALAIIRDD